MVHGPTLTRRTSTFTILIPLASRSPRAHASVAFVLRFFAGRCFTLKSLKGEGESDGRR
jgi:hypothetical protein